MQLTDVQTGYRYPGLSPFETRDAALFYGRERESRDLAAQVQTEKMVVLFSRSGMGKSSLLNAGLVPLLEKSSLLPIRIRLNREGQPLAEQFLAELEKEGKSGSVRLEGGLRAKKAPLWEQLKAARFEKNGQPAVPLFLLDQFEELFTLYSAEDRQSFVEQLADLCNETPPEKWLEGIRKRIAAGEKLDVPALEASPKAKFIFSIRNDLLHLLNGLTAQIPDLLRSRFELLPLQKEAAEEAVTLPAMLRGAEFLAKPFSFDEAALTEILGFLTKKGTEEIESFQLQIVCRAIEKKVVQRSARSVEPSLFEGETGLAAIFKNFYLDQIDLLPADQKGAARAILEESLITENERRRSVGADDLAKKGAGDELLKRLEEMRLVRKEPRLKTFYYEISHDTLLPPILEQRRERRKAAEQRDAERRAAELEAKLADEKRRTEEAERLKTAAVRGRRLALLAAAVSAAIAVFAFFQWQTAQKARNEAVFQQEKAEKAETATREKLAEALREKLARLEAEQKQEADRLLIFKNAGNAAVVADSEKRLEEIAGAIEMVRDELGKLNIKS